MLVGIFGEESGFCERHQFGAAGHVVDLDGVPLLAADKEELGVEVRGNLLFGPPLKWKRKAGPRLLKEKVLSTGLKTAEIFQPFFPSKLCGNKWKTAWLAGAAPP